MAQSVNRLSARFVASATIPGRHSDGGNLYLVVDASGAKRWAFLFRWSGKLKEMGLGGLRDVTLARAREKAAEARAMIGDGLNPIEARRVNRQIPTFGEYADGLVEALSPQWRNAKHRAQWGSTLKTHAAFLRDKRVDEITVDHVLKVLKPIWSTKAETASRLRGRIERVLDAAKAKGYRAGENPATWRGNLKHLLAARQKLTRGHHAAMPWEDVPTFMVALRGRLAVSALLLEFTILTCVRSGESLGALWPEMDLERNIWTVPKTRTKDGLVHRVPLSEAALAVLAEAAKLKVDNVVFPGRGESGLLSVMAMEMLLRRMKLPVTPHGFRSSFRTWVDDTGEGQFDVGEMVLSHKLGDETSQAYNRNDMIERRRALMDLWAKYCGTRASVAPADG
jgi:integrase